MSFKIFVLLSLVSGGPHILLADILSSPPQHPKSLTIQPLKEILLPTKPSLVHQTNQDIQRLPKTKCAPAAELFKAEQQRMLKLQPNGTTESPLSYTSVLPDLNVLPPNHASLRLWK